MNNNITYTKTAILLHWLIAGLIIIMVIMGFIMEDIEPKSLRFEIYQLHKSLGITILLLSCFRLVWRLLHKPPALAESTKPLEKLAAHAGHGLFYFFMIMIPVSGWVIVSTSSYGIPTYWFGLFEWPHLPILPDLDFKESINHNAAEAHEIMVFSILLLLGMHITAALKHHFQYRDDTLTRMIPFLRKKEQK